MLKYFNYNLYKTRMIQPQSHQMHSLDIILQINLSLCNSSIIALKTYQNQDLYFLFRDLLKNWEIYELDHFDEIFKFIRINEYLWSTSRKMYEFFYPHMPNLIASFRNRLKIDSLEEEIYASAHKKSKEDQGLISSYMLEFRQEYFTKLKRDYQVQDTHQNYLFSYFLQEQEFVKKNRDAYCMIEINNEKKSLKHFISQSQNFNENGLIWQAALNRVRHQNSFNCQQTQEDKERAKKKIQFMNNAHEERLVQCRCLGCSTFFYQGMNISDKSINNTPIVVLPSVTKMKAFEPQIKDQICCLLNSGGGVILFHARQEYKNIIPLGDYLSEKSKEQVESRIYSYLSEFHPHLEIKKNIYVSFVPMIEDPYGYAQNQQDIYLQRKYNKVAYIGETGIMKQHQLYRERKFIKGLYVTRIRICPTDATKLYMWKNEENIIYCTTLKRGIKVQIPIAHFPAILKQKFNHFYIPDKYGPQQRALLKKPNNCFNHQCLAPQIGLPISTQLYSSQPLEKKNFEDSFNYLTMLIAKRSDLPEIKRKLKQCGVQCKIQCPFQKYNFKTSRNTAVLYHNIKFDQLLRLVRENPRFKFSREKITIVSVTAFVRLQSRNQYSMLSEIELQSLQEWLHLEFPHEDLKMWQFDGRQHFLQTDSRLSTQFMYFLLNNYNQPAKLKNPEGFERLSQEQRSRRWKRIDTLYNGNRNNKQQSKQVNSSDCLNLEKSPFPVKNNEQNMQAEFEKHQDSLTYSFHSYSDISLNRLNYLSQQKQIEQNKKEQLCLPIEDKMEANQQDDSQEFESISDQSSMCFDDSSRECASDDEQNNEIHHEQVAEFNILTQPKFLFNQFSLKLRESFI